MLTNNTSSKIALKSKLTRSKLLVGFLGNYNSLNTRSAYKCDLDIFFRFLTIVFNIDKDKSLINEINVEHAHLVVFKEYLQKISHGHSTINKISLL